MTQMVMVTAHGASERTLADTRALGLGIVEATCPLVQVAHRAIRALVRDGYHPVIIGQRTHVEVRGLTEDLDYFDVVLDESEVQGLEEHQRIGITAQTTQPIDRVRHLVALIRRRFPQSDVRFIDTVCHPTKQRQDAAVELARRCHVVVVVGGANSNNTRELVHTCSRHCTQVHHVQTESDLRPEWFPAAAIVGITAGTSTPDEVIDRIDHRIRELAARARRCWLLVVVFAIGMAWLEAATVYYLRVMVDRLNPYQADPLPMRGVLGQVELVREAATLLMLLTIGAIAGRTWRMRLGYTAVAFGIWDIFYYVFLKAIYDWPKSPFDWDILFLLPLPWWGPVLAPLCIAFLMIVWGTLASQCIDGNPFASVTSTLWRLNWLGVALALYVFMADSLRVVNQGLDVTRSVLPKAFNWSVFVVAFTLMAAPVAQAAWRMRLGHGRYPPLPQSEP
jgi:4-hydroxy-3-methylbut-2-enyl diphosphate reductase